MGQNAKITSVAVRVLQQLKTSTANPIERNNFFRLDTDAREEKFKMIILICYTCSSMCPLNCCNTVDKM